MFNDVVKASNFKYCFICQQCQSSYFKEKLQKFRKEVNHELKKLMLGSC